VKLGAENRNKVIAAAALGLVAVALFVFQFSSWFAGSSSSASTSTTPTTSTDLALQSSPRQRGNTGNRNNGVRAKKDSGQNLDPSLRFGVLKTSEDTKYDGNGRNIFRAFVEPPPKPIVNPVIQQQQAQQGPAPPPPPPPIELKFYGFATPAGGTKRIFLAHNEDVFIAKEGDIVDRRYKIVRIAPNSVEILDVLSNNRQSIPLTQG
jgi:hypothetical protein